MDVVSLMKTLRSESRLNQIARPKSNRPRTTEEDLNSFEKLLKKMSDLPEINEIIGYDIFEIFKSFVLGLDDLYYSNVVTKSSYKVEGNPLFLCLLFLETEFRIQTIRFVV